MNIWTKKANFRSLQFDHNEMSTVFEKEKKKKKTKEKEKGEIEEKTVFETVRRH